MIGYSSQQVTMLGANSHGSEIFYKLCSFSFKGYLLFLLFHLVTIFSLLIEGLLAMFKAFSKTALVIIIPLTLLGVIQLASVSPKSIIKVDIVTPIGGISLMTSERDIEALNVVNRKH
jgi:hypothetical protein